ncbi:MAG: hypothetical protein K5764_03135 [Prevotella sp.]|nr:hypothetical protein [Prevotella sp.]
MQRKEKEEDKKAQKKQQKAKSGLFTLSFYAFPHRIRGSGPKNCEFRRSAPLFETKKCEFGNNFYEKENHALNFFS